MAATLFRIALMFAADDEECVDAQHMMKEVEVEAASAKKEAIAAEPPQSVAVSQRCPLLNTRNRRARMTKVPLSTRVRAASKPRPLAASLSQDDSNRVGVYLGWKEAASQRASRRHEDEP